MSFLLLFSRRGAEPSGLGTLLSVPSCGMAWPQLLVERALLLVRSKPSSSTVYNASQHNCTAVNLSDQTTVPNLCYYFITTAVPDCTTAATVALGCAVHQRKPFSTKSWAGGGGVHDGPVYRWPKFQVSGLCLPTPQLDRQPPTTSEIDPATTGEWHGGGRVPGQRSADHVGDWSGYSGSNPLDRQHSVYQKMSGDFP